ncbi:MAG: hypothetical protein M3439_04725 [Chloroflexota bacterium]|nr:hypothetical protein [Chloroflexota bacterium]
MTAGTEQSFATLAAGVQVRRAWLVLGLASLIFAVLAAGVVTAASWVYHHATEPEVASLMVVSGSGALVRSPSDTDWRLVTGDVTVREGDRVSTALGTVITLELFDGSTVEVTEDTIVRIARMRSSRFLKRTKLIVLEPERGTIYISMAPRGTYVFSEITTRVGDLRVTMTDEPDRSDDGAYLVEVRADPPGADLTEQSVRAAVLHGAASVQTEQDTVRLEANQQTLIEANGSFGEVTTVERELVVNGDFSHGLSGWIEFEQESQRHTGNSAGTIVELAQDDTTLGSAVVVEFARAGTGDDVASVGIRQRIGKTLRVHTSLLLSFEARIMSQQPLGGGEELREFPLIVQIEYIDVDEREQTWSHGYYAIDDPESSRHIPVDRGARINYDRWQRIIFDLRGLSPLPKQITSIVVYASGESYQTRVANVSLTTSELAAPEQ